MSRNQFKKSVFLLKVTVLLCLFFGFSKNETRAGDLPVQLDTSEILLGSDVRLHLQVKAHKNQTLAEIQWDTLFLPLEVLRVNDRKREIGNDSVQFDFEVHLIAFDTGHHVIYPFPVYLKDEQLDQQDTLMTEASLLSVYKIEVDLEAGHRPIKDILGLDWSILDVILWILVGWLILGVIALAIYFYQKRKRLPKKVVEPVKPEVPAHIEAMQRLEELQLKKYPVEGDYKTYFIELTFIIRDYLEKRYNFDALEQTTPEIISSFQRYCDLEKAQIELANLLRLADFVKFAKGIPTVSECDKSMDQALRLIELTKPEEKPETKKQLEE